MSPEPSKKLSGDALLWSVVATCGSGFVVYGYDQGLFSGLIQMDTFLSSFPETHDPIIQAAVVAIYELGAFLGSIATAFIGDILGRRRTIVLGACLVLLGTVLQAVAGLGTLWVLVAGRVAAGLGIGVNTATIPVWQSEMARSEWRGTLVMTEGALIVAGLCCSYWLNYIMFMLTSTDWQWRLPIVLQAIPTILLLIGVLLLPESPRWELMHGDASLARETVARIQGCSSVDDPVVEKEMEKMSAGLEEAKKFKWADLVDNSTPEMNGYRAWVGLASQAFQQLAGINVITYYITVLFMRNLHFPIRKALLISSFGGTEYLIAAIGAIFLIDRAGRRHLMFWTALVQGLTMIAIAICVIYGSNVSLHIAAALLFVFNTSFAIGWQALTWLYPSEVTNTKTRSTVASLAGSCNWLINTIIVLVADPLIHSIGGYTYLIFGAINLIMMFPIHKYFPETKGRSLEEIDLIFGKAFLQEKDPVALSLEVPDESNEEAHEELDRLVRESSENSSQVDGNANERTPLVKRR